MKPRKPDPVTLELIRCRLEAGAQQMAVSLWKSSYSTVIREVLDYSTAIFDDRGRMVAQSAQLPFQMMTMSAPLQHLQSRRLDWQPGDVVLLNDPYDCAGQHLPDVMTFRPVFQHRRLVGFTGAIAHMIDMGGGAPGSYLATATEIFQEGLRLPPIKIIRAGRRNEEALDIIRLNVREPEKTIGDLTAMIACTAVGGQVLRELAVRHGVGPLQLGMAEILDGSERLLRSRIKELAQGAYRAVDFVDDDGIRDEPIRIELALTIKGDSITTDFGGSSPQARGPVNATLAMTETTVNYAIMAALGRGIPKNDGCRRAVRVVAPARSVVNAQFPAPVVSRVTTCHRMVDVMLQALAQVIPNHVMAGYYGVSNICNLGSYDPKTGRPWVHFEIEVGGWGGRPNADGLDGFSAHIHNLANTPVEVVESAAPLRVERYELVPESGGKGKFRGGLGLRRDIRVLTDDVSLNLLGDHCKFAPKGLLGGGDGARGRYVLNPDTPAARVMPSKLSNYRMKRGDVISMQTPGGGGYGDPRERNSALIERDRAEEKIKE
ncbi:MAG: hydantoinase B/oxoprolinase family protein [Verrucomicrobia bacterium]|nr:hydantoinase B/oxoprolinase family protein [Verrucomicrobiota bacterium]